MDIQTSEFSVTENPGILLFCIGCHYTTNWVHGSLPPPPPHTHTEGNSWSLLVFLICQSGMPVPPGCWEDKMRLHKAWGLAIRECSGDRGSLLLFDPLQSWALVPSLVYEGGYPLGPFFWIFIDLSASLDLQWNPGQQNSTGKISRLFFFCYPPPPTDPVGVWMAPVLRKFSFSSDPLFQVLQLIWCSCENWIFMSGPALWGNEASFNLFTLSFDKHRAPTACLALGMWWWVNQSRCHRLLRRTDANVV